MQSDFYTPGIILSQKHENRSDRRPWRTLRTSRARSLGLHEAGNRLSCDWNEVLLLSQAQYRHSLVSRVVPICLLQIDRRFIETEMSALCNFTE